MTDIGADRENMDLRRTAPDRRPRGRAPGRAVLAAALVVASTILPGPVGGAQQDDATDDAGARALEATLALAPPSPPSPDDPFQVVVEADERATEAALDRLVATEAARRADEASDEADARLAEAVAATTAATERRDRDDRRLADERERLSALIVAAYVSGTELEVEGFRAYVEGDTTDPSAGRRIMFEQVLLRQQQVTDESAATLDRSRAALADAEEVEGAARSLAEARNAEASARRAESDAAEAAHRAAVDEAAAGRDRLRSAPRGRPAPQEIPLIGLPRLGAGDLASWFASSPYRPRIPTPIEDFAEWFIAEGRAEGIRGDVAFAQAVLETGGFANGDSVLANNYSGIGHCDACSSGWVFPSPEAGVRAQIQLLKSYAVRAPEYVNDLVDRRLRGPAGCCATWGELTTVWATDPDYGTKVMFLYSSMVDHALARRAVGIGFDDPA